MAPPRKNDFLDASDSEDDGADGYRSDDEVAKGGRSAKRRKVDSDADADADADAVSDEERDAGDASEDEGRRDGAPADEASKDSAGKRPKKTKLRAAAAKPLTKKNLVASDKAIKRSGVVFLSRIPPFMKPAKVRSLLEPYGAINRTFLTPEDAAARARRIRAGGNKKHLFTEGWVEFVNKKEAKAACELLNARCIGGKKGSYYRDDIWSLVYLKGFKWHHLTEQIAAENAERASRMRAEISKATKENKEFVRNVERAKMLEGMQAKSQSKKKKAGGVDGGDDADGEEQGHAAGPRPRTFKQVQQIQKTDAEEQPEQVVRVLGKIF